MERKPTCVIVVPVYRETLSETERCRLAAFRLASVAPLSTVSGPVPGRE